MPLDLNSTAPLRGEKPRRRWTLIVMGHGRWGYQEQTLGSLDEAVGLDRFDRLVLSLDGGCEPLPPWADGTGRWEDHQLPGRQGLTANLTQAWGALTDDDEWVAFVEEDWLIRDFPLDDMADTLEAFGDVANMVLVRDPVSPQEQRAGSVLGGQHVQGRWEEMGGWVRHRKGFWLNPFVAHADTLRSLTPGTEDVLTAQCLERGWSFGYWGSPEDEPRCRHLGACGGMGSPGWLA